MTFVVGMWVTSSVVVFSALLCPGRQVATRSSPTPSTPPLVGWVFPLAPSGTVLVVAGEVRWCMVKGLG